MDPLEHAKRSKVVHAFVYIPPGTVPFERRGKYSELSDEEGSYAVAWPLLVGAVLYNRIAASAHWARRLT